MSAQRLDVRSPETSPRPGAAEAPLTLTTEPPRPLGFVDQLAMWGNLGISLFGPLTGALVATTTGSVGLSILAIVVGCGLGALLLGASAMFGTTTGAPAMVSLRGLVGRRGSIVPTLLNIAQNLGWATMERRYFLPTSGRRTTRSRHRSPARLGRPISSPPSRT